jgi:hypothetical protein
MASDGLLCSATAAILLFVGGEYAAASLALVAALGSMAKITNSLVIEFSNEATNKYALIALGGVEGLAALAGIIVSAVGIVNSDGSGSGADAMILGATVPLLTFSASGGLSDFFEGVAQIEGKAAVKIVV